MKRYILFLVLAVLLLIAFSACYEVNGTAIIANEAEPVYAALAYDVTAQDLAQTVSWQEAYANKLHYYAQMPTSESESTDAEWRFMLHDINQNGIPELFIVMYYDGLVNHHSVYSFVYGNAERLKSDINSEVANGIMLPQNGAPGIIRVISAGISIRYDKFMLYRTTLFRAGSGDVVESVDIFRINAHPVTEEDFVHLFGRRDEKILLALHEITEASILDAIFGW